MALWWAGLRGLMGWIGLELMGGPWALVALLGLVMWSLASLLVR